jgi:hypothetical protein
MCRRGRAGSRGAGSLLLALGGVRRSTIGITVPLGFGVLGQARRIPPPGGGLTAPAGGRWAVETGYSTGQLPWAGGRRAVSAVQHHLPAVRQGGRLVGDAAPPDAALCQHQPRWSLLALTAWRCTWPRWLTTGRLLATQAFPASTRGYVTLVTWVERFGRWRASACKARSLRVRPDPPSHAVASGRSRLPASPRHSAASGRSDPIVRPLGGDREPPRAVRPSRFVRAQPVYPATDRRAACGGFARSGPGPCPAMLQCQR